ncbi:unnamed protein product, partial [Iphiclides podalirius]
MMNTHGGEISGVVAIDGPLISVAALGGRRDRCEQSPSDLRRSDRRPPPPTVGQSVPPSRECSPPVREVRVTANRNDRLRFQ